MVKILPDSFVKILIVSRGDYPSTAGEYAMDSFVHFFVPAQVCRDILLNRVTDPVFYFYRYINYVGAGDIFSYRLMRYSK